MLGQQLLGPLVGGLGLGDLIGNVPSRLSRPWVIGFQANFQRIASRQRKTTAVQMARSAFQADGPIGFRSLSPPAPAPPRRRARRGPRDRRHKQANEDSDPHGAGHTHDRGVGWDSFGAVHQLSPLLSLLVGLRKLVPPYVFRALSYTNSEQVTPSIMAAVMIMAVWMLPATSGWRAMLSTAHEPILPMP